MNLIPRTRSLVLGALTTALLSSSAFAIETVTVTAERRAQDVQTVPIAVTAVSAEQLQKAQVRDFNDLQMVAPSLLVSTGSGDTSGGLVRIRGVGTTGNNAGLEASVGVFVDGVYRSRSAAALEDLIDVDHIEVLRGPQGTLFGKNTTAGAITISTRKPSQDFDVEGTASGGTLSNYRFTGHISGGITDTLSASLAGLVAHRDGYLVDVNDGHRSNSKDHWGAKGQLLWEPNSVVTLRIIGDYMQKADSGSDAPFSVYSTRDRLIQDVIQSPASTQFGLVFPDTVVLPQTGAANQFVNFKNYRIAENYARVGDVNDYGVSAQLDLNFEGATVTSITGYRHFASNDQSDPDYSPGDLLLITGARGLNETYSEEVTVKWQSQSVDYLVGGYYSNEKIGLVSPLYWGTDGSLMLQHLIFAGSGVGYDAPHNPLDIQKCIVGLPNADATCTLFGLTGVHQPIFQLGDGKIDHFRTGGTTSSAFTHDIWHITDDLDLTLGARVNYERKHGTYDGGVMVWHNDPAGPPGAALRVACGTNIPPFVPGNLANNIGAAFGPATAAGLNIICPRAPYDAVTREGSLTGTGNLSWRINEDMMIYGGYSRGFKTGPFNLDPSWKTTPTTPPNRRAETDDNFEVGARMTLLDGHALLNTTVFHTKFTNFQINTFNGLAFAVSNFKHVYADGIEVESTWQPIDDLTINLSSTYTNSRYGHDAVPPAVCALVPAAAPVCVNGKTLTQAPRFTVQGGVGYETNFSDSFQGFVNVNANYRSHYNTGSDLNPFKDQPGFALVNGQIGVRDADGMWEFAIWGRNIFNEHYNVVAFNTPFQGPSGAPSTSAAISVFPGEPAVYGATLSFKFD
jgi:iron complex outermembrane receptor protein